MDCRTDRANKGEQKPGSRNASSRKITENPADAFLLRVWRASHFSLDDDGDGQESINTPEIDGHPEPSKWVGVSAAGYGASAVEPVSTQGDRNSRSLPSSRSPVSSWVLSISIARGRLLLWYRPATVYKVVVISTAIFTSLSHRNTKYERV